MSDLRQIESLSEFTMLHKSPPDVLFIISGELLNKAREEFDKGRQARVVLEMIVKLGLNEGAA